MKLNDKFFLDNKYWTIGDAETIITTEKWKALIDMCIEMVTVKTETEIKVGIITEEIILEAIEMGIDNRKKKNYYVYIKKDELKKNGL